MSARAKSDSGSSELTLPSRPPPPLPSRYPFAGPELYLFSDSDALCDTTSLEALIAKRAEDKGADKVMSHNFKTTPHVLHMRFEKDEYERARSERGGPPDHVVRPDFATHLDLSTITRCGRRPQGGGWG